MNIAGGNIVWSSHQSITGHSQKWVTSSQPDVYGFGLWEETGNPKTLGEHVIATNKACEAEPDPTGGPGTTFDTSLPP